MVSIYSLRLVYTFLYTIINGNIIASTVQKKKSFEILWPKKNCFCVWTQPWNPLHFPLPCTQSYAFGLTPLLPVCEYLLCGWSLSIHQSDFCCNGSCINQLLSIVQILYEAFGTYPTLDARGVFPDMSKAFDKVWHEGLIYKLKSMGVSDLLLKLIQSFLTNRLQRVLLNG